MARRPLAGRPLSGRRLDARGLDGRPGLGALSTPPVTPPAPSGDGSMDFSIATGDNTALLALLEDI